MSDDDQDVEENVWKINEEQRVYYLNQFRVLQPAEKGVVTGRSHYPHESFNLGFFKINQLNNCI